MQGHDQPRPGQDDGADYKVEGPKAYNEVKSEEDVTRVLTEVDQIYIKYLGADHITLKPGESVARKKDSLRYIEVEQKDKDRIKAIFCAIHEFFGRIKKRKWYFC